MKEQESTNYESGDIGDLVHEFSQELLKRVREGESLEATTAVREHNPEAGFVYCLHDGHGHYKIGRTKYLSKRIHQLGTQGPFRIELKWAFQVPDAAGYERHLHHTLADCRLNGEWFSLTDSQVDALEKDCAAYGSREPEPPKEEPKGSTGGQKDRSGRRGAKPTMSVKSHAELQSLLERGWPPESRIAVFKKLATMAEAGNIKAAELVSRYATLIILNERPIMETDH